MDVLLEYNGVRIVEYRGTVLSLLARWENVRRDEVRLDRPADSNLIAYLCRQHASRQFWYTLVSAFDAYGVGDDSKTGIVRNRPVDEESVQEVQTSARLRGHSWFIFAMKRFTALLNRCQWNPKVRKRLAIGPNQAVPAATHADSRLDRTLTLTLQCYPPAVEGRRFGDSAPCHRLTLTPTHRTRVTTLFPRGRDVPESTGGKAYHVAAAQEIIIFV